MKYCVYILSNKSNKMIYIGVTNNLSRRLYEHKTGKYDSFTRKFSIYKLVYYEEYSDIDTAISREKQLKRWIRLKKDWLIEGKNPNWDDWSEYFV